MVTVGFDNYHFQVFYDASNVKQVDVPSFSGSFGILPAHVPTLAVLKPGVVTIYEDDGKVNKIFVSSGTVAINDDSSVQVICLNLRQFEIKIYWKWRKSPNSLAV